MEWGIRETECGGNSLGYGCLSFWKNIVVGLVWILSNQRSLVNFRNRPLQSQDA